MGLESLPHLALGNTKKGLTQIVIGQNEGSSNKGETAQWLVNQKDDIKEQAYQTGRSFIAGHTKTMNKVCEASYLYSPTLKSLEYFSEVSGLISAHRDSLKILRVKNPVCFGAEVFKSTKTVVGRLGARVSYYAPSKIVGLEAAKKGMLIKDSFFIDYNSQAATDYANESEANIQKLNSLIGEINYQMKGLNKEALSVNKPFVADAVELVLDLYHLFMRESVETGLSHTIIEDVLLNRKIYHARDFAPKMLELYDYAERYGVVYETAYPSYVASKAELVVKEELEKTTEKEYALYSEIFDHIKANIVNSSSGNRYQMGYLIPQNIYINRMIKDLEVFRNQITGREVLDKLRRYSEC